jgi:hypothetical protein
MSKRAISLIAAIVALTVAVAAGVATAAPGAAKAKAVTIVMHDPGCHWFQVGSKFTKSLTVKGPAAVRNIDEAALIVVGTRFNARIAVGKILTISKPGAYHITMVKQAPDDNHLLLIVK